MKQYHDLMQHIIDNGVRKDDRTGTGTLSVFGHQMRFDLQEGFPLVTTKKVHLKSVIHELLWMIKGDTNIKYLNDNGVTIWDEWRRPWTERRAVIQMSRRKANELVNFDYDMPRESLDASRDSIEDKLRNTWAKMINRCYNPSAHNYKYYGGRGVTVHKDWHSLSTFVQDVQKIPHWWYKLKNWEEFELDKDYYGANQYGPSTCIWLSRRENVSADWLKIVTPEGEVLLVEGYAEGSELTGISKTSLHRFVTQGVPALLKGNNRSYEGWSFQKIEQDEILTRKELIQEGDLGPVYGAMWRSWPTDTGIIDQLHEVITSIRRNPDSRRMLVSSWNAGLVEDMALPPCHILFQFYVVNGKLSCQLYQRSADVLLGCPFNIASYSLLTMMIAHVVGLMPGEFIWTGGDCHLYLNHLEQAKEQLGRAPKRLPEMLLNCQHDNIDDFVYDDFELIGYDPWPAIKVPVAV